MSNERGMNKKEFARAVGVSVPTIDRLMRKGTVQPCKIGRRVVFLKHHLQQVWDATDKSKQGPQLTEHNVS